MDEKLFEELLASVQEAKEIMRGKRPPSRQFRIEAADVKRIRADLGLSQREFAALLGVSVDTVQNWEQSRRQPRGAARLLLLIAQRHPEALLDVVQEVSPNASA